MSLLHETFSLVFAASWRVGLLIVLLLAFRRLVRGRIPEQILFIGWVVVTLRLLIPFGVPTPWSPFNFAKPIQLPSTEAAAHAATPLAGTRTATLSSTGSDQSRNESALPLPQLLALIWAAGVTGLVAVRLGAMESFRRKLRMSQKARDERAEAMVRCCRDELHTTSAITVVATKAVNAPALYGIFQPRLLLPFGFSEKLSDDELRLVVLHELGHWRRHDLLVQSLLHLGWMLHWFNPLVWLATRQARIDCELACDEFVLRRQTPDASCDYGSALLKVMSTSLAPTRVPMALGVLEDRGQIKERISRVAAYRVATTWRLVLGGSLVTAIALLSATHETWAQEAVKSVVSALTKVPPAGWQRVSFYNGAGTFEVGLDPNQPFRGNTATGYVCALTDGKKQDYRGLAQACLADDYRGKRVRFSAWMKTEDVHGTASIWFRIDGEKRHGLQEDTMRDRPVKGTTGWKQYSAVLDVPFEAVSLNYGFSVTEGTGQAWFCDPRLEVIETTSPSTNTVHTRPEPCPRPACASNICGKTLLPRTIVNSSFVATTAK